MKKLSKIKLHEVPVLSENEMKMIFGGSGNMSSSGSTDCSTTCDNGDTIEIKNCNGTCTADDGRWVECEGATQTLKKSCN